MEETASQRNPEGLLSRKSRKWILPALWLILVVAFVQSAFSHSRRGKAASFVSEFSNSSHPEPAVLDDSRGAVPVPAIHAAPGASQSISLANLATSDKVAVIIETRKSGAIVPLILHFSAVLGPSWPLIIYTSPENFGYFSTAAALVRHQRSGQITVRALGDGVYFPNWDSVSHFLTTPWLWNDLAPAEHIFIFQSDSIICANAARSVEDFFDYDFIGAPIIPQYGAGYNGGLSLRRRSTMLRVLDTFEWAKNPNPRPEDQWFFARLRDLEDEEIEEGIVEGGINLPDMEVARTFAVETIDFPHPLGLHQPTRFIHEHLVSLDEWCPEYKLATTERIG